MVSTPLVLKPYFETSNIPGRQFSQKDFHPYQGGVLGNVWRHLRLSQLREGVSLWHLVGDQGCCQISYGAQDMPQRKNDSASNANDAKVQNQWFRANF